MSVYWTSLIITPGRSTKFHRKIVIENDNIYFGTEIVKIFYTGKLVHHLLLFVDAAAHMMEVPTFGKIETRKWDIAAYY